MFSLMALGDNPSLALLDFDDGWQSLVFDGLVEDQFNRCLCCHMDIFSLFVFS